MIFYEKHKNIFQRLLDYSADCAGNVLGLLCYFAKWLDFASHVSQGRSHMEGISEKSKYTADQRICLFYIVGSFDFDYLDFGLGHRPIYGD